MFQKPARTIFSKIGLKLIIPYLVISFLTLLLIGGILYYSYRAQIDAIQKIQEEISLKTSNEVNFYISNIIEELKLLSKNVSCLDCKETNILQLKSLTEINPSIYEVSIIDRHGREQSKLVRYKPKASSELGEVANQEKFKRAIEENFYISSVYISTYNLPFISISLPIVDKTNTKIGVVAAEVDLSPLWGTISKAKVKKTGYVYLVDQNGHLIAYKDVDLVKQSPNLKDIQGVKNFLNHTETFATYNSFNKEKVIGNWKPIEVTGWGLVIELPTKEVSQETLVLLGISGISVFLFLSFIGIVLFIIYKQLLVPLGYLQQGVSKVQSGNLDYKINLSSKDEIGNLADTFNQMTSQLQQSYQGLEQKVAQRTQELSVKLSELEKANQATGEAKTAMLNLLEDARVLEVDLKEERDRAKGIITSMGEGLIVIDKNFKAISINSQATKLLEIMEEKAINQPITSFLSLLKGKLELPFNDSPLAKIFQSTQFQSIVLDLEDDIYFKTASGRNFPVAVTVTPLKGDGVTGAIIVFRDITTIKQLDEAKTGFISVASHQLRTPLTSMRWFSEMLIGGDAGKITEEQKHFVERIYQGTDRMIALVNLLLQIARVEAGRVKIEPVPVDLKATTQGVMLTLKANLEQKAQTVEIKSEPDPFPSISLDQEVVWQVIQNLLSNASRYSPEKSTILVSIVKKDSFAQYSVKDQGIGIPKEQQKRIFEKFFRGENALKMVPEGSGLGLSLVKMLVEGWGGKIWFETEEGKGSTFYFTVPLSGMKPKAGEVKLAV